MANKTALLKPAQTTEWETPQKFFDNLNKQYHFTLDVCATKANAKCKRFYTKSDDGLKQPWNGRVWCNPPYGRKIEEWVKKAVMEYYLNKRFRFAVMLLPSRTDTSWFHTYLYGLAGIRIEFIKGRLKFGGTKNSAPFPSMLAIIGEENIR
jgi:site-specific DNA-methyltransferase (adenine-specific)